MDASTVESTRRALHAVGELIMAGPQYRRSGTIRLQVCAGGFETRREPLLRVDRDELVVGARRVPLHDTTCAALGAAAGVDIGAPIGVYHDGSGFAAQDRVDVDPAAAEWLAGCLATGAQALRGLDPEQEPVLWPEHFDLAIRSGEVNYGVSPGDAVHPEPYAYVGPDTPPRDDFWNEPFGAARPMRDLADADAVLAFFTAARRRLTSS